MNNQSYEFAHFRTRSETQRVEAKENNSTHSFFTSRGFRLASRLFAAGLLASLSLGIALLRSSGGMHLPEWLFFLGRFHPLVLHLPIGLLALLPILHLLARVSPPGSLRPAVATVLWLVAGSTVTATLLGLLLSQEAGYQGNTVLLHRQFAVALSILTILLLVSESESQYLQRINRRLAASIRVAYRILLPLTLVCLAIAAHHGATLTHGATFLTEHLPASLKAAAPTPPKTSKSNELPANNYASVVAPILEARCTSCHGAQKSKGGLRLDSLTDILAGGDSQRTDNKPTVVRGSADQSLLISSLALPIGDDDHMPPSGKPQLTTGEIATLRHWIDAGADATSL